MLRRRAVSPTPRSCAETQTRPQVVGEAAARERAWRVAAWVTPLACRAACVAVCPREQAGDADVTLVHACASAQPGVATLHRAEDSSSLHPEMLGGTHEARKARLERNRGQATEPAAGTGDLSSVSGQLPGPTTHAVRVRLGGRLRRHVAACARGARGRKALTRARALRGSFGGAPLPGPHARWRAAILRPALQPHASTRRSPKLACLRGCPMGAPYFLFDWRSTAPP